MQLKAKSASYNLNFLILYLILNDKIDFPLQLQIIQKTKFQKFGISKIKKIDTHVHARECVQCYSRK